MFSLVSDLLREMYPNKGNPENTLSCSLFSTLWISLTEFRYFHDWKTAEAWQKPYFSVTEH